MLISTITVEKYTYCIFLWPSERWCCPASNRGTEDSEGSATTSFRVEDGVCRFLQQVSTYYYTTWHLVPESVFFPVF